jgi:TatD DNase family protein
MMKNKQIYKQELSPGITLIDTHCHLDMDAYENDLEAVIQNAADSGISRIVTIGIDLSSSRKAVKLAKRFPHVWSTIGIHPHNATDIDADTYEQLIQLAQDKTNKIVGYGEIGLDFAKNYAPQNIQIRNFELQLDIAKKLSLPVIIHDRDAHDETLNILKAHAPFPSRGVMHCFSGDIELAHKVTNLGFYISIPGIVTFNKSDIMQQVAREIPLEKMILETDGPFLSPVPYRGKTNKPEYLLYTANKIAELRGITLDEVAKVTTFNAKTLFSLPQEQINT